MKKPRLPKADKEPKAPKSGPCFSKTRTITPRLPKSRKRP
jgi:hypothetical protein